MWEIIIDKIRQNCDTVGYSQICYTITCKQSKGVAYKAIDILSRRSSSHHHLLQPLKQNSSQTFLYLILQYKKKFSFCVTVIVFAFCWNNYVRIEIHRSTIKYKYQFILVLEETKLSRNTHITTLCNFFRKFPLNFPKDEDFVRKWGTAIWSKTRII